MKNAGFSLIELMVVIAIIAILAAIAIPAYSRYQLGSRMSTAIPIIDYYMEKSIQFYTQNGRWGNAYDFGESTNSSSGGYPSYATSLNPYINQLNGIYVGQDSSTTCQVNGRVQITFDQVALGVPGGYSSLSPVMWCEYWEYQGVVQRACFYNVYNGTASLTDNFIGGDWHNASQTASGDDLNVQKYEYNLPSFTNATTCNN